MQNKTTELIQQTKHNTETDSTDSISESETERKKKTQNQ